MSHYEDYCDDFCDPAAEAREDELGAKYGDPRRCPRHPHVKTSSPDGMFDSDCGECEYASDMAYEELHPEGPEPLPVTGYDWYEYDDLNEADMAARRANKCHEITAYAVGESEYRVGNFVDGDLSDDIPF